MAIIVGRFARREDGMANIGSLVDFLPFEPSNCSSASIGNGDLTVWSWDAPGDSPATRCGDFLLAVDGTTTESGAALISKIASERTPQVGDLAGSFAAVVVGSSQLLAFSSPGAEYPLYWSNTRLGFVVSNRPGLVVGAAQPEIDQDQTLHMAVDGFFPAGYGMYCGVHQLLPGERLRARIDGGRIACTVDSPEIASLFEMSRQGKRKLAALTNECIDGAMESLRNAPASVSSRVTLSGGKDSRAVVAMLAGVGMLDRVDRFTTNGALFSTDVLGAHAVASALSVDDRHVINQPVLQFEPGNVAAAALATLSARGSALSVFNVTGDYFEPDLLTFSGHQTALKPSGLSRYPTGDFDEFAHKACRHNLDPAEILTNDARAELMGRRRSALQELRGRGVPTDRLAAAVQWQQRGGGWTGNTLVAHRAANRHFNPLMDAAVIRLTLSLPRACNDGELIQFLLTSRSPVNLVDVPFGAVSWRPELRAALEVVGMAAMSPRITPGFGTPKPIAAQFRPGVSGLRAVMLRSMTPVIKELALAHRASIPFVDAAALEARLDACEAGRIPNRRAETALLGLATVLLSTEYGTALFSRNARGTVAADLAGRLASVRGVDSPAEIIEIYRKEVQTRDEVIAEFCRAERNRDASRAARLARIPKPALRAANMIRRIVR